MSRHRFAPRWTSLGILAPAAFTAIVSSAVADVPRQIHYQGKLRDTGGAVIDGTVSLRFRLYDNAGGTGTPLFDETHASVTVSNGLLSVLIGSQAGDVPDAALDAAEVYLGVSVNSGTELTPRPRIVSNPHAIKARSSEQFVKPGTFEVATTVDAGGSVDHVSDGATVRMPRKSTTGDPAGQDGMIYYNEADATFRAHEAGQWGDMRGGSGEGGCPDCDDPWELVGTIDTTVSGAPGLVGSIDISDGSREYLVAGFRFSNNEFTVGASPPWGVLLVEGSNVGPVVMVKTTAMTWERCGGYWNASSVINQGATLLIRKGATWGDSAAASLNAASLYLEGSNNYVRIRGNGIVRLDDLDTGDDAAVLVFRR